ncbi:MAG: Endonuclease V [Methanobacterium sp. PtaU1.Bin242]|nr:MAG: Endonuclease V [Methanobacterium sp. PtaU1.Bin242]
MYPYDLNYNLANIQIKLAKQVIKEDIATNYQTIAGVDVSFSQNDKAVAAAVLMDRSTMEIKEKVTREVELTFPYIPGFLGFRESSAMISVLNCLKNDFDVIMINGHGILHPRGFGLASHVGVMMNAPTIGLAKRLIVGSHIKDASPVKPIRFRNDIVGAFINGYYVSIGHKISLKTALKVVKETSIFKTPEPVRQAHIHATKTFKNILSKL